MAFGAKQKQPLYISDMMERLGIDPSGGVVPHWSLSYLTALHRCQDCKAKKICRTWLDEVAEASLAPRFCPNAEIFFEIQMEQPGPHYGDRSARMAMA